MKGNEGKPGKPIYKKWWFWVVAIIIVGGIGGALDKDKDEAAPAPTEQQASAPATEKTEPAEPVSEPVKEESAVAKEEPAEETSAAEATAEQPAAASEALDKQAVLDYTANMRGRAFLKEIKVGKHDISISYHPNFKEYKAANPDSSFTEEDYVNYFSSGDEINKIMMEESARLLKEFPAANEIKISLPFEGKTYSVDLKEEAAEKFFDVDFDTLKASDPTGGNAEWRAQVSNKYFNDADRQRFVDEFVTVQ